MVPAVLDGDKGERVLLLALVLFVAAVAALPLVRLAAEAFWPGGRFAPHFILDVWATTPVQNALRRTMAVVLPATLLSLVVGAALALLVGLTDLRAKTAIVFCFMLPMTIAPQVTALAWLQTFGPSSALLKAVGLAPPPGAPHPIVSPFGITLLLGIQHAPLVFIAVRAGLRNVPRDLVEAAQAAGARPFRILRTVIMPLLTPALAAGAGLAFVSAIGNFGIPALLGIPAGYTMLVTLIYQRLSGFGPRVLPEVAAIALLVGLIAAIGLLLAQLQSRRRDVRAVSLAAATPGWALGRWRAPVTAFVWLTLALVVLAPLLALGAAALAPAYGVPLTLANATFEHFSYVLFDYAAARRALVNSFSMAGLAALCLALVAAPLAVFAEWRRSRPILVLAAFAELPYALPGVVLGIAMILVFLQPVMGIAIYNTIWIIFIAYLSRFLTLAWRPVSAGLAQVDRALDEAAQASGAGFLRRLGTIVMPAVAPSIAAGFILVFLTAFNELTVSALLWSSGAETLGVLVFSLEQAGESSAAAAVALLTVIITLALMLLATALARRLPAGVLPWRT